MPGTGTALTTTGASPADSDGVISWISKIYGTEDAGTRVLAPQTTHTPHFSPLPSPVHPGE
ncbi:hypothetical protein B6R96_36055 (plasmid) [Streptomyces sp. Sge12]|nr:hypothetical protein B6R96_36055 [Streptomyces sp. Sge12]